MDSSGFDPLPPRPTNWAEVFAITGSRVDVPIELIERGQRAWEYTFGSKDMRGCGRKSCPQEHGWGWIVALPGGGFTNIGHDCADRYANKDLWQASLKVYRARLNREARHQAIAAAREAAQQVFFYLERSDTLTEANALYESFVEVAPGPLLNEIIKRADRGETRVEVEHYFTESEREIRRAQLDGDRPEGAPSVRVPHMELRTLGDLVGLRAFKGGRSPKEIGIRVGRLAESLLRRDPSEDDVDGRKALDEDRSALQDLQRSLVTMVTESMRFFSEANLKLLVRLPLAKRLGIRGLSVRDGRVHIDWKTPTRRSA